MSMARLLCSTIVLWYLFVSTITTASPTSTITSQSSTVATSPPIPTTTTTTTPTTSATTTSTPFNNNNITTPTPLAGLRVFHQNVIIDGETHTLTIDSTQEPVDVMYKFFEQHGLLDDENKEQRTMMQEKVCAAAAASTAQLTCHRSKARLWHTRVMDDHDRDHERGGGGGGVVIGQFELFEQEEPVDAVYAFVQKYNLSLEYRHAILVEACKVVSCSRVEPVLWRKKVLIDGETSVEIQLLEGKEVADVIFTTMQPYDITLDDRRRIFHLAKIDGVEYTREYALLLSKVVTFNHVGHNGTTSSNATNTTRGSSNESDDVGGHANGNGDGRNDTATDDDDGNSTTKSTPSTAETHQDRLQIFDDGREPIDIIYEFIQRNKIEANGDENDVDRWLDELSNVFLSPVCQVVPCMREQPVIHTHTIYTPDREKILGKVEILRGEEPIDAIDRFVLTYQLDEQFESSLVKDICGLDGNSTNSYIKCNRLVPIVYRQTVNDENGKLLGTIEVARGEEVIDAVVRFLRTTQADVDEITLKNYMFRQACPNPRVLCTRNVAKVFSNDVRLRLTGDDEKDSDDDDSSHTSTTTKRLEIMENEEPVDRIYTFCKVVQCPEEEMMNLLSTVCATDMVICNRMVPVIFSMPLRDPEGNYIGDIRILENEEPADATYKFFARHGLFKTDWSLTGVIEQICNFPALQCSRHRAIKFHDEDLKMGNKIVGPLLVWEDEEVIDKLYELRFDFNLTLKDQMMTLSDICTRPDVQCARSQAIVYELKDLSKLDFEKYGNETCSRKYNGWQFLSSVSSTSIGSMASDAVRNETFETIACHPLSPLLFLGAVFCLTYMLTSSCRLNMKFHFGHKLVLHTFSFLCVSVVHTKFVEPENEIDHAMHLYEGKLPDLKIYEGQEPVDALLLWGKAAAKDHHPIVREPIYFDILDKVCAEIKHVQCTRMRAWRHMDMGEMTVQGQGYKIDYFDPNVVPETRNQCEKSVTDDKGCAERVAKQVCERILPVVTNCIRDLKKHIINQIDDWYSNKRLNSKDTYVKLGLEMDAPQAELYPALSRIVRSNGMNISPFRRVDNGTAVYPKWDTHTNRAFTAKDAFDKVEDPESREWNDKPCTPYFGGALCAKTDKDGNMIIEV